MTSELVVERVHIQRPSFAEKVMSDKRLIDVAGFKPDSSGTSPAMTSERVAKPKIKARSG